MEEERTEELGANKESITTKKKYIYIYIYIFFFLMGGLIK